MRLAFLVCSLPRVVLGLFLLAQPRPGSQASLQDADHGIVSADNTQLRNVDLKLSPQAFSKPVLLCG